MHTVAFLLACLGLPADRIPWATVIVCLILSGEEVALLPGKSPPNLEGILMLRSPYPSTPFLHLDAATRARAHRHLLKSTKRLRTVMESAFPEFSLAFAYPQFSLEGIAKADGKSAWPVWNARVSQLCLFGKPDPDDDR
jgi:hypothetical protein